MNNQKVPISTKNPVRFKQYISSNSHIFGIFTACACLGITLSESKENIKVYEFPPLSPPNRFSMYHVYLQHIPLHYES